MPVPPVESVANGPSVWVVPSGLVTVTVKPFQTLATFAEAEKIPRCISTSWLTPTVSGIKPTKVNKF